VKILLISDMHTEFWRNKAPELPPLPDFDVVVAAGDIGVGGQGLVWLRDMFEHLNKPVLYVPGNHEYYNHDYETLKRQLEVSAPVYGVTLLNPGTVTIDGWKFIGANLWTDFKLKGYQDLGPWDMDGFADFRVISDGDRMMTVNRMKDIHEGELAFIKLELAAGVQRVPGLGIDVGNQKTIVITHFVPSQVCVHPKWYSSKLNPYFTNDLDDLFDQFGYPLHLYGHTHDRSDIVHPFGTRLVANPLGYPKENPTAFQWKVIE
jgi:Icc-related predicted phosphoesterase